MFSVKYVIWTRRTGLIIKTSRRPLLKELFVSGSTLTKHITPPTSTVTRQLTSEKRREVFIEHKKAKFKLAKSLVDVKNESSVKCQDIIALQNSDCEISYTSLLQNGCIMEKYGCDGKSLPPTCYLIIIYLFLE